MKRFLLLTAFCSCFGLLETFKILLSDKSYKLSLSCCCCYYFYCWVVTSVEFCRWVTTSVHFWHKSCKWVSNGLWCKRVIPVWKLPLTMTADTQLFEAAEVNSVIQFSQVTSQHHKHVKDTHLSCNIMHQVHTLHPVVRMHTVDSRAARLWKEKIILTNTEITIII